MAHLVSQQPREAAAEPVIRLYVFNVSPEILKFREQRRRIISGAGAAALPFVAAAPFCSLASYAQERSVVMIFSILRSARAVMVTNGLTPMLPGMSEPSMT